MSFSSSFIVAETSNSFTSDSNNSNIRIVSSVILLIIVLIVYFLLFPSRTGDVSRISLFDRFILAFRLLFARIKLFISPMKTIPISKLQANVSSSAKNVLFFDSALDALKSKLSSSSSSSSSPPPPPPPPPPVFYFSGFAATESPFVWFQGLAKYYDSSSLKKEEEEGITIITQTGSSLRGVGSISLDNFIANSKPGVVKRLISGHLETLRSTLKRAEKEKKKKLQEGSSSSSSLLNLLEIYNLPLGVISRLVGLQSENNNNKDKIHDNSDNTFGPTLDTTVGLGTYLENDPNGYKVTPHSCSWNLVERKNTTTGRHLTYKIPKITHAFIHAKIADTKGNIHFSENTVISDAFDAAMAAKKNGGKVFVSVEKVIDFDDTSASYLILKRDFVDAIVVVDSVLQEDFSGLSQFCRMVMANKKNKSDQPSTSICEYWERATLGWALATTFHSRWRNTDRHVPVITHCHDEVLRLAKMFMIQDAIVRKNNASSPSSNAVIIRILIGVSLPELVAMRLVESGNVFVGGNTDPIGTSENDKFDESQEEKRLRLRVDNDSNLDNFSSFNLKNVLPASQKDDGKQKKLPVSVGTPILQLAIESGVVGGLPCPGFLFGNSFNPYKILRGPDFWNLVNSDDRSVGEGKNFAHMCILGAGEVDVHGNVNVSNSNSSSSSSSSSSIEKIIGCGGFPDICDGVNFAIVFVVSILSSGTRYNRPKGSSIVQKVSEVTFSPLRALLEKKCLVRYCTEFGVFKAELWSDDETNANEYRTRLVAPPGLELLIQEKCGVKLFL